MFELPAQLDPDRWTFIVRGVGALGDAGNSQQGQGGHRGQQVPTEIARFACGDEFAHCCVPPVTKIVIPAERSKSRDLS
jgi:hypothetical protein